MTERGSSGLSRWIISRELPIATAGIAACLFASFAGMAGELAVSFSLSAIALVLVGTPILVDRWFA